MQQAVLVRAAIVIVALAAGPATARMHGTVAYHLSCPDPASGQVHVRMTLPPIERGPRVLVMPRAIPMGYGEQPYDRFVHDVAARSEAGTPLEVRRETAGPRWRVGRGEDQVRLIEYDVDVAAMERAILSAADASRVRPGYLSLLGYSVFAYVDGLEERPVRLEVEVPAAWPCLTTLAPQTPMPKGSAGGTAADFYALADSQVVAGPDFSLRRIDLAVPLFLGVYAEGPVDPDVLADLVREAMGAMIGYFGSAPFAHYTVLQELLEPVSEDHSYGFSMEHLDSATFYLGADRGVTAASGETVLSRVRYNLAHHFAHAWIPKRSFGTGYYPFTWELAPVLDTIWFSEGFAQYAAADAIADGMPPEQGERYRRQLVDARFRRSLEQAPRFIREMSTVELSRVASTRYSQDFRTGRNVFSRGGLMAAEMDALIREQSGGERRLRDALRYLVAWSARARRPFRIEELPELFAEATGVETSAVMERWLAPVGP